MSGWVVPLLTGAAGTLLIEIGFGGVNLQSVVVAFGVLVIAAGQAYRK